MQKGGILTMSQIVIIYFIATQKLVNIAPIEKVSVD